MELIINGRVVAQEELRELIIKDLIDSGCMRWQAVELAETLVFSLTSAWCYEEGKNAS